MRNDFHVFGKDHCGFMKEFDELNPIDGYILFLYDYADYQSNPPSFIVRKRIEGDLYLAYRDFYSNDLD